MLIQGGELVMGTLCKKTLGASGGSLIHVIWMEEGPEAARAFLSQTQYLVNHWLLQHGFSIGIGDTVADVETMTIISNTISKARAGRNLLYGLRMRGGPRAGGATRRCPFHIPPPLINFWDEHKLQAVAGACHAGKCTLWR